MNSLLERGKPYKPFLAFYCMKKFIPWIIIILIIISILFSSLIFYFSLKGKTFCTFGDSCGNVQNSDYGTLFGMPVSLFGTFSFSLLLLLYLVSLKTPSFEVYFVFSSIIGSLFSLYFIFIQFFLLHAFCSSCLIVDGSALLILLLFFLQKR